MRCFKGVGGKSSVPGSIPYRPSRRPPTVRSGRSTLVVSPHVGANTHEARSRVGVSDVEQIADYLDTGHLDARNCVNRVAVTARDAA